MPQYLAVNLNTTRNILWGLPPEQRAAEARRNVRMFVLPREHDGPMFDSQVPDHLVSDQMVERYLQLSPPIAAVIPEFQRIIDEIERTYVIGAFFATVSASCVTTERLLNMARIELHQYHPKIKSLWDKGPSNSWDENIDALATWR